MTKPPAARSRRRGGGFTLLELLVAMTILSFISLLILSGLKFGAIVWKKGETASSNAESLDAAQNFLRHLLMTAYPKWVGTGPFDGRVLFDGEEHRIAFLAPPPEQFGPGPVMRFELGLSHDGDLELLWSPGMLREDAPAKSAALLHGVGSVQFGYFGRDIGGSTERWQPTWSGRASNPKLIRMQVTFPDHDRRVWPEFIIQPRVRADVACIYDPISRGCRGRPE
jgi:general secretion pathway protein J